jgi:hypothetical protein
VVGKVGAACVACVLAVGCTPQTSASPVGASTGVGAGAEAGTEAGAGAGARVPEETPTPSFDEMLTVLFAEKTSSEPIVKACPTSLPSDARVRCLYDERYKGDAKAAGIAHELFVKWHTVAGVEIAHTMNGGYRGMIRIEPAVPVGENRKHLEWVAGAIHDFDAFFAELEKYRVAQPGGGGGLSVLFYSSVATTKPYRFHPITLRFMRSIAARTPAAYAHDWTVAYNFVGTLNVSADAVRETMFHEIFHLNDAAHHGWSTGALGTVFDAVVKKCGVGIPCLAPYSPNETIVRGGTYYSFQPGNGVMEYAAELALRYYREQRAVLRNLPRVKPFKCGPPENAKAWAAIRDEFFAGTDAVPACP